MPVQTLTPRTTEVKGAIISVDPDFFDRITIGLKSTVNQATTNKIYASTYDDPTMAKEVLIATIALSAGNVTAQTAGFDTDAVYSYFRVGSTPGTTANAGTVVAAIQVREQL
jgi:hypothetical protein